MSTNAERLQALQLLVNETEPACPKYIAKMLEVCNEERELCFGAWNATIREQLVEPKVMEMFGGDEDVTIFMVLLLWADKSAYELYVARQNEVFVGVLSHVHGSVEGLVEVEEIALGRFEPGLFSQRRYFGNFLRDSSGYLKVVTREYMHGLPKYGLNEARLKLLVGQAVRAAGDKFVAFGFVRHAMMHLRQDAPHLDAVFTIFTESYTDRTGTARLARYVLSSVGQGIGGPPLYRCFSAEFGCDKEGSLLDNMSLCARPQGEYLTIPVDYFRSSVEKVLLEKGVSDLEKSRMDAMLKTRDPRLHKRKGPFECRFVILRMPEAVFPFLPLRYSVLFKFASDSYARDYGFLPRGFDFEFWPSAHIECTDIADAIAKFGDAFVSADKYIYEYSELDGLVLTYTPH